MSKYKIAWMPGDGLGNDVMEAARLVLDRLKLDAEYVPCDIGWDFWCKEGNALPDRTAIVQGDRRHTWRAFDERAARFAAQLGFESLALYVPAAGDD